MARTAGFECIEKKIEKAQINVVKTKQKYDAAVANLADLIEYSGMKYPTCPE